MTKKTNTDIAVTEEKQLDVVSDQLPDFLSGGRVTNDDNFDNSDIVIPRIKLLQGISSEIETFDSAKSGHFWHTGLDMNLGTEIRFIVADRRKKYLLQAPITDGQGVLARSDDAKTWDRTGSWQVKIKGQRAPVTWTIDDLDVAKSGLANWGTSIPDDENSPPAATLFYDYLVYLPDHPELGMAVMSVARAAIKKAKKGLNDKISMHAQQGRAMQALVFSAKSVDDTADGQDFKNWQFQSAGFVQDKELYEHLRGYRGALANVKIKDEGDADGQKMAETSGDSGEGDF